MSDLKKIFPKKLNHHAYLFVGGEQNISEDISDILEDIFNMKRIGNPDFLIEKFSTLSADDARKIKEMESRKSVLGNTKIFLIEAEIITEQAQNALLKVFEEPSLNTKFFIILPQDNLLPTFRSRLNVYILDNSLMEYESEEFLKMNIADRMDFIKKIISDIKDEKITKQKALDLAYSLEKILYSNGLNDNFQKIQSCQLAIDSLKDNGAPVKMILEYLAVSI